MDITVLGPELESIGWLGPSVRRMHVLPVWPVRVSSVPQSKNMHVD